MIKPYTGTLIKDIGKMVDDLTYISYCHNRQLSPHITPEQWQKIFPADVSEMEKRFQKESGHDA